MICGINISRKRYIWMCVYPYYRYIVGIFRGEPCERHDTYGTFASECYNSVGLFYVKNIESRPCLLCYRIPVKHTVSHNPLA